MSPLLRHDLEERREFDPSPPSAQQVDAAVEPMLFVYRQLALRLGAIVMRRVVPAGNDIMSVRVRMVSTPIRSFADRNKRRAPTHYELWDSGWLQP